MIPPMRYLVLGIWFCGPNVWAVCATLIKGPVAIDVQQCNSVHPESAFPLTNSKYNFIRDLPPANRQQFLETYRGLLIKGQVARSMAVRSGLSPEKGALGGEKIVAFIEPHTLNCDAIQSKRIQANINEICCEGGGEAPCLLGTGYLLQRPQLLKEAAARGGGRQGPEVQAAYQQSLAAIGRRDFLSSIQTLTKLKQQKPLGTQGEYLLALSYRENDQCPQALPYLEAIYKRLETSSYWSDEEAIVRRGTLLLARCLSLLSRPGEAVIILQSFLVEPKKFKKEINESLSHQDFGGIRTDKQFIIYRERALKALAQ